MSSHERSRDKLLAVARALGLFGLSRLLTARGVRILCYHGAWLAADGFAGDSMFIQPRTFERRLDALQALGYRVVPLSEAVDGLAGRKPLPDAAVVITIDDGWLSTAQAMVPRLADRRLPATLYCDTAQLLDGKPIANMMALHFWGRTSQARRTTAAKAAFERAMNFDAPMAERMNGLRELAAEVGIDIDPYLDDKCFDYMTPEELRAVGKRGIDIQLHSHNHTLHDFSEAAIGEEIGLNRDVLVELTGKPRADLVHFCYPSGMVRRGAGQALGAIGIASSVTLDSGIAFPGGDIHALPRITDGDHLSELMFEAELSGFMHIVRRARLWLPGFARRGAREGAAAQELAGDSSGAGVGVRRG